MLGCGHSSPRFLCNQAVIYLLFFCHLAAVTLARQKTFIYDK
ncbi:hypothetical protein O59_001277 [Cellvibrio sp. BR]|nr:hypothetical protein O59_001277 [Cellvibrio sp. BR]